MKRLNHFYGVWVALALLCATAMPTWATTRTVHSLADNGGLGTLRSVLAASISGDTIAFSNGLTGTIVLASGELQIGQNITITGPGMNILAISGNNSNRVFNILSGTTVTIGLLTITNGFAAGTNAAPPYGGPGGFAEGGGILNNGTLTLLYCRVSGNAAQGGDAASGTNNVYPDQGKGGDASGGGLINHGSLVLNYCIISGNHLFGGLSANYATINGSAMGAGMMNYGNLTAVASTISDNHAFGQNGAGGGAQLYRGYYGGDGKGGGIANQGTLNLTRCTVYANEAVAGGIPSEPLAGAMGAGGGIWNSGTGTVVTRLVSCTISGNQCVGRWEEYAGPQGYGGGIYNAQYNEVDLLNTIVAGNQAFGGARPVSGSQFPGFGTNIYCLADHLTSQGFNLIGDIDSCTSGWLSSDLIGTSDFLDPKLGPLQDNGGPTPTMALLTNSPAIDKGYSAGYTVDQRGFSRPVDFPLALYPNATGGDGSDIGAYELQLFEYYHYRDIGLHFYDGVTTNKIATEYPAVSALRMAKNGTNYGIILVATNSPDASKFHIQTASGVKSLMKLP